MSRTSLISNCRTRAVWDRPATGTRLLLWPKPVLVSLGSPIDPLRMSPIASAPSRPTCPPRPRAADARVPSPRTITHGSYPQRACPTTVDACGIAPRMISRSALLGVEADACGIAPRMISRSALLGVEADACGIAPRMISRSALLGVEADACGIAPRMISRSALLGVEADACGIAPRMISRSALLGVEADACGIAPRMISRSALLGVEADACGIAPRMISRSALLGVEADACGITPRMTSRAPTLRAAARAAEGALATLFLTQSQSLPTVYAVIPDSDRESIPRGGAAHPERRRRVERGVAHVCQSVELILPHQPRKESPDPHTPTPSPT